MFKQFYAIFYRPSTTPIYTTPYLSTILRYTDLSTKCDIVVLSLTQNSFTSKYTNTTCTELRERPHITSSDRGESGF